MDFLQLMRERYTTKHYDSHKKIPDEILDKILECLRLTPSAVNLQPWHFFLTRSTEGKAKIRAAVPDFNQGRFDDCDCVLILCSLNTISKEFAAQVAQTEIADKRFAAENSADRISGILGYSASRDKMETVRVWSSKQVYIAMATLLYASAAYGVDSTPVEGVDCARVDALMGLKEQGLHCEGLVFLGYRADNDSNTPRQRPKSRMALDQILTRF